MSAQLPLHCVRTQTTRRDGSAVITWSGSQIEFVSMPYQLTPPTRHPNGTYVTPVGFHVMDVNSYVRPVWVLREEDLSILEVIADHLESLGHLNEKARMSIASGEVTDGDPDCVQEWIEGFATSTQVKKLLAEMPPLPSPETSPSYLRLIGLGVRDEKGGGADIEIPTTQLRMLASRTRPLAILRNQQSFRICASDVRKDPYARYVLKLCAEGGEFGVAGSAGSVWP